MVSYFSFCMLFWVGYESCLWVSIAKCDPKILILLIPPEKLKAFVFLNPSNKYLLSEWTLVIQSLMDMRNFLLQLSKPLFIIRYFML